MNREEIQMKRTWRKKIGAAAALLAAVAVLGTGCGADAAGAVESRTRETKTLGLLLSREDAFLSELKADIEAEAAAQGYAVRYYNAGNDPETQLRQVHEALAEGVETQGQHLRAVELQAGVEMGHGEDFRSQHD